MRRGTDTRTDIQTAMTTVHFASATPHAKCDDYINLHDFIVAVKRSDRTTQLAVKTNRQTSDYN